MNLAHKEAWSAVLAFLILAGGVSAADRYGQTAPKEMKPEKTGKIIGEQPLQEGTGDDRVVIPKLDGIRFVSSPEAVIKAGAKGQGIDAREVPMLANPAFEDRLKPYLDHPMTMKMLDAITRKTVLFFREHDRPVVDVAVPEQAVETGVVQILVLEGKLGDVKVEGNRWFGDAAFLDEIRLAKGDPISRSAVMSDMNWINENSFRTADLVYSRGEKLGDTDLTLRVQDRFPVRFYAGYEDTGTDATGDERWYTGFNWGDAFGLGHQMSYQFTGSSDAFKGPSPVAGLNREKEPMLVSHSGSYRMLLPWRHQWLWFGNYSESDSDLGNNAFSLLGKSWQVGTRYLVPLPTFGAYSHHVSSGFDFKQSNNNLDFGGVNVFNRVADVDEFMIGYNPGYRDDWGGTSLGVEGYWSPGYLTEHNNDLSYRAARAMSRASYSYAKFSLQRTTSLPADFTWAVIGEAQISDSNLLGSEQFGLGGYSTIRGYEEREANGDNAWRVTNELRLPPISFGEVLGVKGIGDRFQFFGFWDYGVAENHSLLAGEDPHVILSSAGPGIRYVINPYLSVRFDYGFQLVDSGQSDGRRNSRGHLGVTISY
ncbi:MAG: ShlB/FhaC/HecB family hemolysin secretion/activation protein [Verrucomicrobia bacterium]|nr:ShlB/FhaC/HecB family hemolysin secretion/activation protein [Verrucomicrobiota bacterium]